MARTCLVCCYCSGPVSAERVEVTGYRHCTSKPCSQAWRRDRVNTGPYVLANQHKQGAVWMRRSDLPRNSMRRDGGL